MFGRKHRDVWNEVFRYLEFDMLERLLRISEFTDLVQIYSRVRFYETARFYRAGEPDWFAAWLTQIPSTPLWISRRTEIPMRRGQMVVCTSHGRQTFIRNDFDWNLYPACDDCVETCCTCGHRHLGRLMNYCTMCMTEDDRRLWMLCFTCTLICSECGHEMCTDHARIVNARTNTVLCVSQIWQLHDGNVMKWFDTLVGFELMCTNCLDPCDGCHEYRHDVYTYGTDQLCTTCSEK